MEASSTWDDSSLGQYTNTNITGTETPRRGLSLLKGGPKGLPGSYSLVYNNEFNYFGTYEPYEDMVNYNTSDIKDLDYHMYMSNPYSPNDTTPPFAYVSEVHIQSNTYSGLNELSTHDPSSVGEVFLDFYESSPQSENTGIDGTLARYKVESLSIGEDTSGDARFKFKLSDYHPLTYSDPVPDPLQGGANSNLKVRLVNNEGSAINNKSFADNYDTTGSGPSISFRMDHLRNYPVNTNS